MIQLRGVSKTVTSGGRPLTILHPLNLTIAPGTKLLPEIVNAKLGPPTSAPLGDNALITGVGFGP